MNAVAKPSEKATIVDDRVLNAMFVDIAWVWSEVDRAVAD